MRFRLHHLVNIMESVIKRVLPPNSPSKIRTKEGLGLQTFTVAVEGNIGSGKTTLLEHFAQYPKVEVLPEPVNRWTNCNGQNLMGLMYQDPVRWSLTFQTFVQLTMMQNHLKTCDKPVKLLERSLYSARYCFVENLFQSGKMPQAEYLVLSEWFDWIVNNQPVSVDLIVYLQTTPSVVYERMKTRCRNEEQIIPLSYLEALHELHELWLVKQTTSPVPAPVLILDGDKDLDTMKNAYAQYKDQILSLTTS